MCHTGGQVALMAVKAGQFARWATIGQVGHRRQSLMATLGQLSELVRARLLTMIELQVVSVYWCSLAGINKENMMCNRRDWTSTHTHTRIQ